MNDHKHHRKKGYVILPREDGRWLLTRDGTPSESRVYSSIAEAVEQGRKLARKERVPLRVLAAKRSRRWSTSASESDRSKTTPQKPHGLSEDH